VVSSGGELVLVVVVVRVRISREARCRENMLWETRRWARPKEGRRISFRPKLLKEKTPQKTTFIIIYCSAKPICPRMITRRCEGAGIGPDSSKL